MLAIDSVEQEGTTQRSSTQQQSPSSNKIGPIRLMRRALPNFSDCEWNQTTAAARTTVQKRNSATRSIRRRHDSLAERIRVGTAKALGTTLVKRLRTGLGQSVTEVPLSYKAALARGIKGATPIPTFQSQTMLSDKQKTRLVRTRQKGKGVPTCYKWDSVLPSNAIGSYKQRHGSSWHI